MQELKLTLPIRCKGTIFDVETTGWTPSVGELITIGYVSGSKLRMIQRDDRDSAQKNRIYEIAKSLTFLPHPYMAYNKSFEERWLRFKIDYDLWGRWKELGTEIGAKWPGLRELVPSLFEYFDPELHRQNIPSLWEKYVKDDNEDALMEIVAHNLEDLMKSYYLYIWDAYMRKNKVMKRI
jgi:DNA polymerase III epsilon subunit-like protein